MAVLAIAVAGCGAQSPSVTYYSLALPAVQAVPARAGAALAGKTIGIGPISIPDVVNRPQLPRPAGGGLQLEEFHRWGGQLDREMGRALVLQLSRRLASEQVVEYPWSVPFTPDYQVAIDVLQFSVDLQGQATLNARWGILTTSDEQPRIRAALLTRPVGDPSPGGRAMALRETVADLGEEIASELLRLAEDGN
jgi:hypothetical protein